MGPGVHMGCEDHLILNPPDVSIDYNSLSPRCIPCPCRYKHLAFVSHRSLQAFSIQQCHDAVVDPLDTHPINLWPIAIIGCVSTVMTVKS